MAVVFMTLQEHNRSCWVGLFCAELHSRESKIKNNICTTIRMGDLYALSLSSFLQVSCLLYLAYIIYLLEDRELMGRQ